MNPLLWILIYMPIILFIVIQIQNKDKLFLNKKTKRSERDMSNEMLLYCIGKMCTISTGSLGRVYSKVLVREIVENWMKVEKNEKIDLINTDYIQNIKIL